MVKIELDVADNGIIKTISDDNSNGGGEKLEKKFLYEFENDIDHSRKIKFLYELIDDLGLDIGNIHNENNLKLIVDWGENYIPDIDQLKEKIDISNLKLKLLKELYKYSVSKINNTKKSENEEGN